MDDNIYAAPTASLEQDSTAGDALAQNDFFVVSKKKFYIMFITTLGLYQMYWFYRHWQIQKERHNLLVLPIMRALFPIFFAHSLCESIYEKARSRSNQYYWIPRDAATFYVMMAIISQIFSSLCNNGIGLPFTFFAMIISFLLRGKMLMAIQNAANFADGDENGKQNNDLTAANWAWIVFGVAFWLLTAIGLYTIAQERA